MQNNSSESDRKIIVLEGIGNYVRKSGFNKCRQTYLASNGEYIYVKADGTRICIPNTKENAEVFLLLDQLDHEEDLQDKKEQTDQYIRTDDLENVADGNRLEEVSISHAKMAAIEDPDSDVFVQAFPEKTEPPTEEERIVMEVVSKCPDRWKNYYYDVYGGTCKNQEEYRRREVQETGEEKSLAAISKMDTKLKERVCEALGKPMPPKKRGRKG